MNIGTACCHSASCSDTSCPGRPDPALTRSTQESEYLWTRNLDQCARSGQVDSRQIAAHIAAGELVIGYESADPAHREPVRVAREPLPVTFAGREPFDWGAFARWGAAVALCVLWTVLVIYLR